MKLKGRHPEPTEQPGRRRPPAAAESRPKAFSYYAQRSGSAANTGRTAPESYDHDGRRPDTAVRSSKQTLAAIGLAVAVIGFSYVLWLGTSPRIVPLTSGKPVYMAQDTRAYQQTAAKTLGSSVFNSNKLTVDTASVSRTLLAKYPEIQDVRVSIPAFGHQPVVYIKPYKPAAVLTGADGAAFVIDENGRAVVPTSQVSDIGALNLPTIQDKSGLRVTVGSQALASTTVHFAEEVLAILDAAGIRHGQLVLPLASSELDVPISSGTPYYVKFNLEADARQQTGTFLAVHDHLAKVHETPSQYIDVRLPGRAYYK